MNWADLFQIVVYVAILIALTPLMGLWIYKVVESPKVPVIDRIEKGFYRISGIQISEQNWWEYLKSLLWVNFFGFLLVFLFQMFEANISWHSAFNTAISFMTNTNWQGYAGETTMSNFTQMLALTVQNFLSAATGIAVVIALIRGLARQSTSLLGNFWQDFTRVTLGILLPLSVVMTLILVQQGTVQTLSPNAKATTVEGGEQVLPMGPAASQISIKMLGTNGGGFFNANSAHPFENPTPFTNFLQMLAIFLIPAGLTWAFGKMVKSPRQGWVIFASMMTLFLVVLGGALWSEYQTNPLIGQNTLMEGKETRFGVSQSVLFAMITTSASCGAVNAMHASLSPLTGGLAMFNMMVGEVIFGGVGAGLYGMLMFVVLTVFLAGLMVGRTPEYLGKKIEAREIQWVIFAVLAPCATILLMTGISVVIPQGLSSLLNKGPHGFSEILYAFTSAVGNNGSAFAGLNANTVYYNLMLGFAMLIGRFAVIVPVMAVAGSFALKKKTPPSLGTFRTDHPVFAVLLIAVVVIVGALTFLPALSLGPIVEHFLMINGQGF